MSGLCVRRNRSSRRLARANLLLVVDIAPQIIQFHQINFALLRISKNIGIHNQCAQNIEKDRQKAGSIHEAIGSIDMSSKGRFKSQLGKNGQARNYS